MTLNLAQKKCLPCEGIGKAMDAEQIKEYLPQVTGWALSADDRSISKEFVMKNFMAAVRFIQKIAEIAEKEDHHPDIHLTGYRKLRIDLSTHALKGLSGNDFILAAKINELPVELKQ